jgi:hypothetical protein
MTKINPNSQTVQSHLQIIQAVIQRMASNSASCKTWCITLVSALLIVVIQSNRMEYLIIAYIPIILFLLLDTYYLSLEQRFRNSYNTFVDKYHKDTISVKDLYIVSPSGDPLLIFFKKLTSFSILPFYLTLAVLTILILCLIK